MRRAVAIFAILVFAGPLTAPAVMALVPARVPSCCLRTGSHHCSEAVSISVSDSDNDEDALKTQPVPCPVRYCAVTPSGSVYALSVAQLRFQLAATEFASAQRVWQFSLFRAQSHFERGPPTLS